MIASYNYIDQETSCTKVLSNMQVKEETITMCSSLFRVMNSHDSDYWGATVASPPYEVNMEICLLACLIPSSFQWLNDISMQIKVASSLNGYILSVN